MSNSTYRITRQIDVVLVADDDDEFDANDVTGIQRAFPDPEDLREAGYTVTEMTPGPEENAPGTVRKFRATGDLIVKGADSKWRYVTTSVFSARVGDVLEDFPHSWGPNETVVTS
jgi:hypothetical protein